MSRLGALLIAALAGSIDWWIVSVADQALPPGESRLVLAGTVLLAAITGYLVGSAVFARAERADSYLGAFATLAGGVGFGLWGAGCALALTVGYLGVYGSWPEGLLDRVLYLLAYPAFSALGGSLGALLGMVVGALLAGLLTLARPVVRGGRLS
ncbi:MAG TPA: hypothetical protein VKX16_11830 [Chloroflexota bacterium]|nr:hypothetical protein [Chloroflexota bacterium]